MAGRKLKLTPALIKNAEKLLKGGNYVETVCEYLGIGTTTWYRWMQEGEVAKSGLKRELWDTVKRSEAEAEIRLLTDLQKMAEKKDDPKPIMWMLERKYPDRWGRKDKIQADLRHSGENGGAIKTETTINLASLDDKELMLLEQLVQKSSDPSRNTH